MTGCARLALIAALATACSPPERGPRFRAAGATTPRRGGTLRFSVPLGIRTLDPAIAYDDLVYDVLHPMFDTLVDFSPIGFDIVPRLAARWTIADDGLTYTFELRPGITFHDGAPITAAHFKYSLERTLTTPDSPFAEYLLDLAGAHDLIIGTAPHCTGITALDDHRLELRLARPNPALLSILAMPFSTPQRAEHVARAGDQLRRMPDATGPYELASWDEGNRVTLRRSAHYHDPERGWLDELIMLENTPRDTQFEMFERGELEAAERLSVPDYLYVTSDPAWRPFLHHAVALNAFGSRMNVRRKPFDDRRVRQALNYALDKAHTARLLNGTTVASHGILPPRILGHDPTLAPYPHDLARARALLIEAGYPAGFDVDYTTPADEETEKVTASLQSDLAEVGVRVHVRVVSWPTFQTEIAQPDGPALSFISWSADFPDPINFLDPKFHSRAASTTNDSFYANPELDAVLDAGRAARDPAQRAALYRQAEQILYTDAPWIWDYHRMRIEVTQPYVRGYAIHPIWLRDFTGVWLDLGPDGAPVRR